MPHLIDIASTGRAKCRGCGLAIAAGTVRLGERLPNPYADDEGAEMTRWYHVVCAAFKRPEPFLEAVEQAEGVAAPFDGREGLIAEARLGLLHRRLPRVDAASRAPSGRATCRACKTLIEKGSWRLALVWYEDGRFVPSGYMHASCAAAYLETTAIVPRVRHFSPELSASDVDEIAAILSGGGGA